MTIENSNPQVAGDKPGVWSGDAREMRTPDGETLILRTAETAGPVRADVVLVHGLGEHSRRYEPVARVLAERGLRLGAWDLRGHGRSSGARGDAARHALLIEDIAQAVGCFTKSGRPWFLLAHSFGGQLALRYLEEKQPDCAGAVVFAPWLRLASDPPWWKLALAHLTRRVWPAFSLDTESEWQRLSRDRAYLEALPDVDLIHRRISSRLYFAMRAAGEMVLAEAAKLRVPLLLLHGEDDPITSARATAELYAQAGSGDKTLRTYPGVRHEIHNDLGREEVLAEVADWLVARLPAAG